MPTNDRSMRTTDLVSCSCFFLLWFWFVSVLEQEYYSEEIQQSDHGVTDTGYDMVCETFRWSSLLFGSGQFLDSHLYPPNPSSQ